MGNIFISYRGNERSRVKQVASELKENGLKHNLIHDVDLGDLRPDGYKIVWSTVKREMDRCLAMILLIGDTSHSPKATSLQEIAEAKGKKWYIFGIKLSNRSGSAPTDAKNYEKYVELEHNPAMIVSKINETI